MAKCYLKRTLKLNEEINSLLLTVEELETQTEKITTSIDPHKVKTDFNPHSREDTIVKTIEFKNKVNNKIDELVDLKSDIHCKINLVENDDYRILLTMRYINLKSFEEIAVFMNYSYRHITRLHGWALQEFGKVM